MLLALCITLCAGVWAGAKSAAISDSLVRLHVVAASDEAEEQELKLRVRDSVLGYLTPRLEGAAGRAGRTLLLLALGLWEYRKYLGNMEEYAWN